MDDNTNPSVNGTRTQPKRSLLLSILLSIFVFLLLFGIAEWAVRHQFSRYPAGLYANDSMTRYTFTPDFEGCVQIEEGKRTCFHTNSLGLTNHEEPPFEKPIVLIAGDSFTFSVFDCPMNETYPAATQRALAALGNDYTVLNAGIPGYSITQSVARFKQLTPIVHPSIGVLTFFIGNDIQDEGMPDQFDVIDGQLVMNPKYYSGNAVQRFFSHSVIYRRLSAIITTLVWPTHSPQYDAAMYLSTNGPVLFAQNVKTAEKDFLDFKSYCDSQNITCMVNIVSSRDQVSGVADTVFERLNVTPDLFWVQRHFGNFFEQNNIMYFDMAHAFNDTRYFLPLNRHWTQEGCQLAGTLLAAKLDGLSGTATSIDAGLANALQDS